MHSTLGLFIFLWATCVCASPIREVTEEPGASPLIALGLTLPFAILATAKLVYLRYRRAQSIHSYDSGPIELNHESASQQWVGLGIQPPIERKWLKFPTLSIRSGALDGYLVGCFGSPRWETRIKTHADRLARKATPSLSETLNKGHFTPSEIRSAIAVGSIRSTVNSNSMNTHPRRHSSYGSKAPSVSFLEMTSPKVDITSCGSVHPGSPNCNDHLPLSTIGKRRVPQSSRRSSYTSRISQSTVTPRSSSGPTKGANVIPDVPVEEPSRADSDTSRSFSQTPSFQHPSTADESSATMSSMSSEQFMANLIYPDHSIVLPHDIGYTPTMSPDKKSPTVTIASVATIHATLKKAMVSPVMCVTPPKAKSMASPSASRNVSGSSTSKTPRSSGSDTDDRKVTASPPTRPVVQCVSESQSISTDWLIEDLIRDGMLDVDAVHDALGLGISSPHIEHVMQDHLPIGPAPLDHGFSGKRKPTLSSDANNADVHIRQPGGLLCPIPEETEDSFEGEHDGLTPLVDLWQAACHLVPTEESSSGEGSTTATPVMGAQRSQWYF